MKLTLADFIAMNVRSFPDRQAIEVLGAAPERYTYREMWLRVSALADALREVEPGPHGPVAVTLLPNGTDALLIYLAGQLAGCAIVPVNTRLAHPEILHIVNDSGRGASSPAGTFWAWRPAVAAAADQAATVVRPGPAAHPRRPARPGHPRPGQGRPAGRRVLHLGHHRRAQGRGDDQRHLAGQRDALGLAAGPVLGRRDAGARPAVPHVLLQLRLRHADDRRPGPDHALVRRRPGVRRVRRDLHDGVPGAVDDLDDDRGVASAEAGRRWAACGP